MPAQRWEEEAAALSPDGRRVATLVDASTAVVWDVASRAELTRFNHDQTLLNNSVLPMAKQIAVAGEKQTVLWSCARRSE